MTSARRIAEEIIKGGRTLAIAVLEELHLLDGWRSEPPPETPEAEIVIRYLPKFKFVPYPNPKVAKAQGAAGRWMKQEPDGTWKTAKLPHHITWRKV